MDLNLATFTGIVKNAIFLVKLLKNKIYFWWIS
jgi:hypothetical protein